MPHTPSSVQRSANPRDCTPARPLSLPPAGWGTRLPCSPHHTYRHAHTQKNPPPPPPPPRSPKFNVEGVRAAQMLWPRCRRDRGSTLNCGDRGRGEEESGSRFALVHKACGHMVAEGCRGSASLRQLPDVVLSGLESRCQKNKESTLAKTRT